MLSKKTQLCILNIFIFLGCCTFSIGQTADAALNSNELKNLTQDTIAKSNATDYSVVISSRYVQRFSDYTSKLANANLRQVKLLSEINRLKEQASQAKSSEKKQIKSKINLLELNEKNVAEEIGLIKSALKLLQTNKSYPDSEKLNTINAVNTIEDELNLLTYSQNLQESATLVSDFKVEERNVYTNPKIKDCNLVFNGVDSRTKRIRKEMEKEFLFGHTHPKLKAHFKDKDFLSCEAQITQVHNKMYLWLHITIASKDAIKNYGSIEKSSPLKIELINGEVIYIPNAQNSIGKIEAYTGHTLYQVLLPLDKTNIKQFEKSELDKIGIMWTSGYEQYEVFELDLIMNQLSCLKNN